MNTDAHATRYSTVAIVLHWAMAALLIFQMALGFRMGGAQGPARFAVFQLHKSVGITILLLVAIRVVWRLLRTPPPIDARPWEKALAHAVHLTLYLLMLALPISGWIIVSSSRIVVPTLLYGTLPWPHIPVPAGGRDAWHAVGEFIHVNLAWLLIGVFALHVAGALKHHFLDGDAEIARMAPGVKPAAWGDPRLLAIAAGVVLAAGLGLRWLPVGAMHAAPASAVTPAPLANEPILPAAPGSAPVTGPVSIAQPAPASAVAPTPEAEKPGVSNWRIARTSTLRFRTSWSGDGIDGGFKAFDGTIVFGPDDLTHSKVAIDIDINSVFSGDAQRDETLKSEDWFSVAGFGTATFTASKFKALGGNRFAADGVLKIKGISLPSTVRFTLAITDDRATVRGTATVDRTAYKVGVGEYGSTTEIPATVAITISIDATRVE